MQYTITINQAKSVEWGLNAQQALLFAFVYECPSWARMMRTGAGEFYALSKAKIIEELPILTDKPDTAYRLLKQLHALGLIKLRGEGICLTEKGLEWKPDRTAHVSAVQSLRIVPRRRTKKRRIPAGLRALVFARDGYACLRCGCSKLARLRADHVVPESKGGETSLANLQTLCMTCNSWKGIQAIDFRVGAGGAL